MKQHFSFLPIGSQRNPNFLSKSFQECRVRRSLATGANEKEMPIELHFVSSYLTQNWAIRASSFRGESSYYLRALKIFSSTKQFPFFLRFILQSRHKLWLILTHPGIKHSQRSFISLIADNLFWAFLADRAEFKLRIRFQFLFASALSHLIVRSGALTLLT